MSAMGRKRTFACASRARWDVRWSEGWAGVEYEGEVRPLPVESLARGPAPLIPCLVRRLCNVHMPAPQGCAQSTWSYVEMHVDRVLQAGGGAQRVEP